MDGSLAAPSNTLESVGVKVCSVVLHPRNTATKNINTTVDDSALWSQLIVRIRIPQHIGTFVAVMPPSQAELQENKQLDQLVLCLTAQYVSSELCGDTTIDILAFVRYPLFQLALRCLALSVCVFFLLNRNIFRHGLFNS